MVWHGLKELQTELRALPVECQGEAGKIIEGHVNGAYVTIKRVYQEHRFSGTLSDRLTISTAKLGLVLRSGSPLAWLFDNGSEARHYTGTDKRGRVFNNAPRGRMPGFHVFARTVGFTKRKIRADLKAMLARRGAARVTDDGR
jgi:hypothetical protein